MRRTLATFAALVVAVLGVYLAVAQTGASLDLTAERSATLSDETRRVLDGVDRRLHVTAFFLRDSVGRVEAATLLSRYRDANRLVTFRILDPTAAPGEAERLGAAEIGNAVVEDLAEEETELAQYAIEIDVTSAIARLLRDTQATVCFAEGHGERSVDDDLRESSGILRSNGYRLDTIDLLAEPEVPSSCSAVIMAAPENKIGTKARKALVSYLRDSGRALFLADPDAAGDMTSITKPWGISFLDGVVVEGDDGSHLPDDLTAPIVGRYAGGSAITRGLPPTFFPRVMGVRGKPAKDDEGLTVTELAITSNVSYLDRNDFDEFDPKVDMDGPVPLGASADDSEVVRGEIQRTRIVAWGDVDFATDRFIGDGGNATLWLQAIDWLTQPEDVVGAVPNFPKVRELELTAARSRYVLFLMAGVIPGLFLIAGAMVWVVRRSR
jgi:ABC-2 type transport system permease protein